MGRMSEYAQVNLSLSGTKRYIQSGRRRVIAFIMEVTSAFPLPPDYYRDMSVEEIRQMRPPEPPQDNLTTFGVPILVRSGALKIDV